MASRTPAGARPGARFAQFKLVLLGSSTANPLDYVDNDTNMYFDL